MIGPINGRELREMVRRERWSSTRIWYVMEGYRDVVRCPSSFVGPSYDQWGPNIPFCLMAIGVLKAELRRRHKRAHK